MLPAMFSFLTGYVMGGRSAARAAGFARGAAASSAAIGRGELGDLDDRIDRMLLVIDAMWDLLKEQGFTDEQLAARIKAFDEADGIADGQRRKAPVACTACGSMIPPDRESCVFCGEPSPIEPGPLDQV